MAQGGRTALAAGTVSALLGIVLTACTPAAEQSADAPASPAPASSGPASSGDTLVPGTQYHAVASIPCLIGGAAVSQGCRAGVKRNWSDDGGALIEITLPGGGQRALFTDALANVIGADSNQADGSAGWTMVIDRTGDTSVVDFGPEHYEIPDALVLGG